MIMMMAGRYVDLYLFLSIELTPDQEDGKPAKRGRRSKRVKAVAESSATTSTGTPVMASEEFADSVGVQAESSSRRKSAAASVTWSEDDKGTPVLTFRPTSRV